MMRRWIEVLTCVAVMALVCASFAQEQTKSHVVKKGDTLWDLSNYYLQNPFLWPGIYDANKDKIQDPHWIYPGQEFVIPPGYGGVTNVYTPVTPTTPESPAAPAEEPVVVSVPTPESIVETPALRKVTYEVPVVATELAHKGGYLATDEEITGGYIVASDPPKLLNLAAHQSVYIDRGNSDGVKVGDRFTVFRIDRKVNHPKTGKYLGKIVRVVGTVSVTDVEEKASRAIIDGSYDIIKIKDRIMPYEAEEVPVGGTPEPTEETTEGYIVARRDPVGSLRPFDIVYIDKGSTEGTMVGDIFDIYRIGKMVKDPATAANVQLPDSVIGALQVLKVKENTATAYMVGVYGVTDIRPGEAIRLVSRFPSGG
jgi:hypothetical protein